MSGRHDIPGVRANRRILFRGLGALGVAAALAGCGGDDGGDGGGDPVEIEPGTELATTAEVPVGGGIIDADLRVVVTQPTEGEFKAFTAVCTHQQQTVTSVEAGQIRCRHHGSVYSAETGENIGGPAPAPLAEIPVTVDGDRLLAA